MQLRPLGLRPSLSGRVGARGLGAAIFMAYLALAPAAQASHVRCGDVITTNTTLDSNVGPCKTDAIVVGADNITFNLNNKIVFGVGPTGPEAVGVLLSGRTGIHVTNGVIQRFSAGVAIDSGSANRVSRVTARQNIGSGEGDFGDGIAVFNSSGNTILNNTVIDNGPFSGISLIGPDAASNTIQNNRVEGNARARFTGGHPHAAVGEGRRASGVEGDAPGFSTQQNGPSTVQEDDGIRLEPLTHHNTIVGNRVKKSGLDGIALFFRSNNNTVASNVVELNGLIGNLRRGDGIAVFSSFTLDSGGNIVPIPSLNTVRDNAVFRNAANGIFVRNISEQNQILDNQTGDNAARLRSSDPEAFDLLDENLPSCDNNVWSGNTFETAFPDCTKAP